MSIRWRMTLSLICAMLLLMGGAGVFLYSYMRVKITRSFDDALASKASSLAAMLRSRPGGKAEFDFSDDAMPEFNRSRAPEYFQLWTADGKSLEKSESLQAAQISRIDLPAAAKKFINLTLPDGRPGRAIFVSVAATREGNEGEDDDSHKFSSPSFLLAVARERASLNTTLATIAWGAGTSATLLALAVGLLVPWLVTRNLHPLHEMATQAARIKPDALDTRFPTRDMPLELQPICNRLNDSLERLQAAFERQRRFSANVAHELRTPIAELRLLAEMGVKFPPSAELSRTSFSDALAIARQMENIVEILLSLVDESPSTSTQWPAVDLSTLLDETWQRVSSAAQAKGITFHREPAGWLAVHADETILRRIFLNLLENAVEYAPAQTCIECRCRDDADSMTIVIANHTDTLTPEDIAHLIEPFWRKDNVRTSGRHAGLGLTLVAAYARRIGARLDLMLAGSDTFKASLVIAPATRNLPDKEIKLS